MEPARFDEMRRGCWDPDARIADMDIDGVRVALLPVADRRVRGHDVLSGGRHGPRSRVLRAWNDWHLEAWVGAYPSASSRCSCRGCAIRSLRPRRCGATPRAASRP